MTVEQILRKRLEPYLKEVVEAPENVEAVAMKLFLTDFDILEYFAEQEKKQPTDTAKLRDLVFQRFKTAGIDVSDALDIITEVDELRIKLAERDPQFFSIIGLEFVVIDQSLVLLLTASLLTDDPKKLRRIGNKLKELANALKHYGLLFRLVL